MNMTDSSTTPNLDSKGRFSNRASDYARYRPGYPPALLGVLRDECGLKADSIVADVGSGTGLLTKLFLENGNFAYGIEPNMAMRESGEEFLRNYARFHSVNASAEETTLPSHSIDFVTVGTAFHWFDWPATRIEFQRILKAGGWVAVITNGRVHTAPLQGDYDALLRKYAVDYEKVRSTYPNYRRMEEFFGVGNFQERTFPNVQILDFDGLRGRLLSASYAPLPGHSNHEPMLAELRNVFDAHQREGFVRFEYETRLQYGHLDSPR